MANPQDQGTFDRWITDRIGFYVAHGKSGDTGDFEKWITDRICWEEYVAVEIGVSVPVLAHQQYRSRRVA